jgi:alpha-amylase
MEVAKFLYKPKGADHIKLLLKNYRLSDDIAFRFQEKSWKEWPSQSQNMCSGSMQ